MSTTSDRRRFLLWCGVAATGLWPSTPAAACTLCCAKCGTNEGSTKVCRLEYAEKKITVTCWKRECEEICLPPPSKRLCRHEDLACEDLSDPCNCYHGRFQKMFVWSHWTPCGCPKIVTKKRLMKKTVTKTIPTYKWVVEDLCPQCEAACEPVEVSEKVLIPPAPPVEGAKIIGGKVTPEPK